MKGFVNIHLATDVISFDFQLRRNITIFRDDGATGKTTFFRLVQASQGDGSGVEVSTSNGAELITLPNKMWQAVLKASVGANAIFVLDESQHFMKSREFATLAERCGCYFILITRDLLECLPCSIHEIYKLKTAGKHTTLSPLYEKTKYGVATRPYSSIVTEDSASGYGFIKESYPHMSIISAGGNSNIYNIMQQKIFDRILVIADGAAFGMQLLKLTETIPNYAYQLILEESFEYVLLTSGIFGRNIIVNLKRDIQALDSLEYFTWERFFTAYLVSVTKNTDLQYSKRKFNPEYLRMQYRTQILKRYGLPLSENELMLKSEATNLFSNE